MVHEALECVRTGGVVIFHLSGIGVEGGFNSIGIVFDRVENIVGVFALLAV